jgi:hypothetical protein
MKHKPILTILLFIALLTSINANAQQAANTSLTATTLGNCQTQIVTLVVNNGFSRGYNFTSNQIVSITSFIGPSMYVNLYSTNNITTFLSLSNSFSLPITFTGLTSIGVGSGVGTAGLVTLTILTPITNSVAYTPANSVVIPTDAKGDVQIILQSSSDLVNWIPSLPGTYGSTYSNRFFRVVAVAQ